MTLQARIKTGYGILYTVQLSHQWKVSLSQPLRDDDPHIYKFTNGTRNYHPREQVLLIHEADYNSFDAIGIFMLAVRPIYSEYIPKIPDVE